MRTHLGNKVSFLIKKPLALASGFDLKIFSNLLGLIGYLKS